MGRRGAPAGRVDHVGIPSNKSWHHIVQLPRVERKPHARSGERAIEFGIGPVVQRDRIPTRTSVVRKPATCRSGTNPDDRNRDRDTQTKRAENRQDELRKQIRLGPHIR